MSFDLESNDQQLISDINVTPMVDVMLVLLILFIVTLPLVTNNIPVKLPEGNAEENDHPEAIVISVSALGEMSVADQVMSSAELKVHLSEIATNDSVVHIQGDGKADYAAVIKVMSVVNRSGIKDIGFITLPTD